MKKIGKIGIIGCGNMGKAIIRGLINSRTVPIDRLIGFDKDRRNNEDVKRSLRINIEESSSGLAKKSKIIIIAVKPIDVEDALRQIKGKLTSDKIIISIAAGISTRYIESILAKRVAVIRVMPNTPALVGEAMSVISKGRLAKKSDLEISKRIFSSIGKVIILEEKFQDAVTAISGSGPAYFFYFIESLIDSARKLGLNSKLAQVLTIQTASGSIRLLINLNKTPEDLRKAVTSERGTTEAALKVFFDKGLKEIVNLATKKAMLRSKELSKCL